MIELEDINKEIIPNAKHKQKRWKIEREIRRCGGYTICLVGIAEKENRFRKEVSKYLKTYG